MPATKLSEPLNAVIYARYSSHSQTEQSLEGQLHDSYAYAEKCGYRVIGEYIDRALTGKSDDRPDFQRMIRDAEKHQFQVVIVWKLDRFARNRYDSAMYKRILKKHGVRVVSVMENITDSPEGIILEGMLEALAEYYSANLSENIRRGQQESIKKGWFPGGPPPMGYKVVDHRLVPDERFAPVLLEVYTRYASGESLSLIAEDLNARGYRTRQGRPFRVSTFDRIIPNPAYIGQYSYGGVTVPDLCPPIVPQEIYEKALTRRERNRRAPAAGRSDVEYLLTGKIFCGSCGLPMIGDSGTSRHGYRCTYYSCTGRKHRKNDCKKKSEKQDFIEWYVCEQTVEYILRPDRLQLIASQVVDIYNADIDDSKLKALQHTIQRLKDESNSLMDKLTYAPQKIAVRIMEKMEQLDAQRIDAETDLSKLRMQQKIPLTEEEVTAWLSGFSRGDLMDPAFRRQIIDTFINSVYLYDKKVVIFYNIKDGKQTCVIDPIDILDEIKEAGQSSTLTGNSGALPHKVEHAYIFLHGMLGLVLFRE